ncbi:MAG: hypothetical protein JXR48_13865 [Candidatus Delongbacteria bacterium]|nr:hypothetical protein [Candidatus Delongbacteria bacterium]MBN2836042.1 hypothetical protein [Candidatus Delongbacteria bacterium]
MQIQKTQNTGSLGISKISNASARYEKDIDLFKSQDGLTLSHESDKLHKLAVKTNELLGQIDSLKKDRLEEIKSKIEDGYYNNEKIIEEVAESIVKGDGLDEILINLKPMETIRTGVETSLSRKVKLMEAGNNVALKSYENENVYEGVAQKVIDYYL